MRTSLVLLAIVLLAGFVYADNPWYARTQEPVRVENEHLGTFHVQPPNIYWWSWNASTGFGSELVDDIPDQFYCICFSELDFYVCEWSMPPWIDPNGVFVNIYYSECPPALYPATICWIPWELLDKTIVYDDGWMRIVYCVAHLPMPVHIEYNISIGFVIDNYWGTNPPYCGITVTNDYDVYGDCEGYMDPTYWGYPRWTSLGSLAGVPIDVAYSLSNGQPSASDAGTWGQIKALYR